MFDYFESQAKIIIAICLMSLLRLFNYIYIANKDWNFLPKTRSLMI